MKASLKAGLAIMAFMAASPAAADIVQATPSGSQGLTVHNDGSASTGTTVVGELGQGSGLDVLFTGTTGSGNELRLSSGEGQAVLTGPLKTAGGSPNDTIDLMSLSIALEGGALFDWIELALFGNGNVSFTLMDDSGTAFTSDSGGAFTYALANGQNRFAFRAIDGQSIARLSLTMAGGDIDSVRQVRIAPAATAAVPEPSTWAMLLLGFGAAGFAMRRKRRRVLTQIA